MFKNNFIKLCIERNVNPTVVCTAIGISKSNYSQWSDSSIPRKTTLIKIADYFGVTVDYLLGSDPALNGPTQDPALSDTKKELLDLIGSVEDDEKIKQILEYVEFVKGRK